MPTKNEVWLTGYRSASAAGADNETLFIALREGRSGIGSYAGYAPKGDVSIGKIPDKRSLLSLLETQLHSLLESSSLTDFSKSWLVIGSSVGGMPTSERVFLREGSFRAINLAHHGIGSIGHRLKHRFGFKEQIAFSTACTSSGNAAIFAAELIRSQAAQSVVVVGADALCMTTVNGFNALGVLSSQPCLPFDRNRTGMNVSEAAASLLFQGGPESADLIRVAGFGSSSDAHNITQPHPEGAGAYIAMRNALEDAGIAPEEIAYINAHGTATMANDEAEAKAIARLFGDRVAVHASKAITGHALGAASALELCVSAWVLQEGQMPGNWHLKHPLNVAIKLPVVPTVLKGRFAMSNSFAFGGNNTAIVLERP